MADINVERKGPSVWPWVIGLLVLALLIWGLVEMFGDRSEPMVTDPAPVDTPFAAPAPAATPTPPQPSPSDSPAVAVPPGASDTSPAGIGSPNDSI